MNKRQPNKPLYEHSYERTEVYTDLLAIRILPLIKGTNNGSPVNGGPNISAE